MQKPRHRNRLSSDTWREHNTCPLVRLKFRLYCSEQVNRAVGKVVYALQ